MKKTKLTKYDIFFIGGLLVLSLVFLVMVSLQKKQGAKVQVSVDNKVIGTYLLERDQEIPLEIDGEVGNTVLIQDQHARMVQATCPDRLCMHQREISKQGETIVCLPHKVVVEICSEEQSELDGFSQ